MDPLLIIFLILIVLIVVIYISLCIFQDCCQEKDRPQRRPKIVTGELEPYSRRYRNESPPDESCSIIFRGGGAPPGQQCEGCRKSQLWIFPQNLPLCHMLKKEFCLESDRDRDRDRARKCPFLHYEDCRQENRSYIFRLVEVLEGAKNEILICVFAITSTPLSKILRQLKRRIARIRIITDADALTDVKCKVPDLVRDGIQVKKNKIGEKGRSKFMHHKFAIIDQRVFIHGSFNWSHKAANVQYELLDKTEQLDQVREMRNVFNVMWGSPDFVDVNIADL